MSFLVLKSEFHLKFLRQYVTLILPVIKFDMRLRISCHCYFCIFFIFFYYFFA